MKLPERVFLVCVCWLGWGISFAQERPSYSGEVLRYVVVDTPVVALTNVTVLDGTGTPARADQTILIESAVIRSVGARGDVLIPEGASVYDFSGHTVMPGIIGVHNHLHYPGAPLLPYSAPRLYLAGGVTTIQTTGSAAPYAEIRLADSVATGQIPGPTIFPTGPYITGPEGNRVMVRPSSEAEARDVVRHWAEAGATWIKLYRHVQPDVAQVVIEEAHAQGLKVTGHLCSLTMREGALMGIDSIEHGLLSITDVVQEKPPGTCVSSLSSLEALDLEGENVRALIGVLIEHDVTLTSTLAIMESHFPHRPQGDERALRAMAPSLVAAYEERQQRLRQQTEVTRFTPALFQKILAFERAFVAAGGRLAAGPDTGRHILPGYGDQRNFELLVEAGFHPAEAVQIMTFNGATALGIADRVGTLQTGMQADLVVIDGELEATPGAIRNVVLVFKQGTGFDPAKLIADVEGQVGLR